MGDVLPDLAVTAGRPPLEHAVPIQQAHRQTIDLRFGDIFELRILDPLPRQVIAHPGDPGPQLVRGARVRQRQHPLGVAHLLEVADRFTADPLGRGIRGDELGMVGLDLAELVDQGVVDVVADLRIVEDVIPVAVVVELLAQLRGALCRRGRAHGSTAPASTSRAAGTISRARS